MRKLSVLLLIVFALTSVVLAQKELDSGNWRVYIDSDPVDDSVRVVALLDAESGRSVWGEKPTLALRLKGSKIEAWIDWGDYIAHDGTRVTWRIDNRNARSRWWGVSTDNAATFYPLNEQDFIEDLLAATQLVARVTPYNENPITAVFDLTGIGNALVPMQEARGWDVAKTNRILGTAFWVTIIGGTIWLLYPILKFMF